MNEPLPSLPLTLLLLAIGSAPALAVGLALQFGQLRRLGLAAPPSRYRSGALLLLWLAFALVITDVLFVVMPPSLVTMFGQLSSPMLRAFLALLIPSIIGATVASMITRPLARWLSRGLTSA